MVHAVRLSRITATLLKCPHVKGPEPRIDLDELISTVGRTTLWNSKVWEKVGEVTLSSHDGKKVNGTVFRSVPIGHQDGEGFELYTIRNTEGRILGQIELNHLIKKKEGRGFEPPFDEGGALAFASFTGEAEEEPYQTRTYLKYIYASGGKGICESVGKALCQIAQEVARKKGEGRLQVQAQYNAHAPLYLYGFRFPRMRGDAHERLEDDLEDELEDITRGVARDPSYSRGAFSMFFPPEDLEKNLRETTPILTV